MCSKLFWLIINEVVQLNIQISQSSVRCTKGHILFRVLSQFITECIFAKVICPTAALLRFTLVCWHCYSRCWSSTTNPQLYMSLCICIIRRAVCNFLWSTATSSLSHTFVEIWSLKYFWVMILILWRAILVKWRQPSCDHWTCNTWVNIVDSLKPTLYLTWLLSQTFGQAYFHWNALIPSSCFMDKTGHFPTLAT